MTLVRALLLQGLLLFSWGASAFILKGGQQTPPILYTTQAASSGGLYEDYTNVDTIPLNNLATYNGVQYLGFISHTTFKTKFYTRNLTTNVVTGPIDPGLPAAPSADSHYNVALSFDTNGYVHLVYGNWANPLKYYKSNSPENVSAFSSASMLGTNETQVTYPQFIKNPTTGALYFTFRSGVHGAGYQYFYHYVVGTTSWEAAAGTSTAGQLLSGSSDSPPSNPYLNGLPVWDASGNLFWCFSIFGGSPQHSWGEYLLKWNGTTFTNWNGVAQTIPAHNVNLTPAIAISSLAGADVDLVYQQQQAVGPDGTNYITYQHNDAGGIHQVYVAENHTGTFVEHQLTSYSSTPSTCGSSPGNADCQTGPALLIGNKSHVLVSDLLGGTNKLLDFSSTDYFSTVIQGFVLPDSYSNPNFTVNIDATLLPLRRASFLWMDADAPVYGIASYSFSTSAGSMYLFDWTGY